MIIIFKVRKRIDKRSGQPHYRYSNNGHDWNHSEMGELEKITLIFSPTMSAEDINRVKARWSHKL